MKQPIFILLAIIGCHHAKAQVLDCDNAVYCQGELLDVVQMAKVYNDSKTFVDMVQINSQNITLENFQKLLADTNNSPTRKDISKFINENFESGTELEPWTPVDYNEKPDFLNKINDSRVKEFAQTLVKIWPVLGRKVKDNVFEEQDRHSFIPLPNGFIVPGGRFQEIYYWDSYWIIKGLLMSGMNETVRGILENFISLIQRFGFIPNGSRIYYLNRSQPPLFSAMVGLYMKATNNITWLEKHIDTIEQELNWWLENRSVTIERFGKTYKLAQYNVKIGTPRPESYSEDVKTCAAFEGHQKEECYRNLKSGAESGWDFSTRWFFSPDASISTNLTFINMTRLVPVDVNAFLCRSFREIADFYRTLGNTKKANEWDNTEEELKQAIQDILYNDDDKIWYDWDIELSQHRKAFVASNLAPLWAEAFDPQNKDEYGSNAVDYLEKNGIDVFFGGTPMSLIKSGQQWDFPNAWPPLQDIIVMGLKYTENDRAVQASKMYAERTLNAYMTGYNTAHEMFEKYDAVNVGEFGGGGEYVVQSGFGWTNGVAFSFIELLYCL